MTMTIEKKLRDFHFWNGAATNAAKLTPEELDRIEEALETFLDESEEPMSVTEVNNWMWFDFETVCEWANLNYEEVMARE